MKFIQTTALALLLGLTSGCSTLKTLKYIKGGSLYPAAFKTEVAFEMRLGLIVLKVKIHGKEHSFILDSGAPDAISKELAAELGIKNAGNGKLKDSQGNSSSLGFAAVDSMDFGGLLFLNVGTAIVDLPPSNDITCFNVDGIIGANLMRKAIWEIDYERHIITITSSLDSLTVPANAQTVKFHTDLVGVPMIDVQLNGVTEHNVIADLGSNHDFNCSMATYKKLEENGLHTNTYEYGAGSSGAFGRGKDDTTWYTVVSSIGLGNLKLTDQVVDFSEKASKTIGTNFFKHYRLIFDWSAHELTMIPVSTYDNTSKKSYSFSLELRDNKVFISSVRTKIGVAATGPQLGDQVLEIDRVDYRTCSHDSWCGLLSRRFYDTATSASILVKRGDKELKYEVEKEAMVSGK